MNLIKINNNHYSFGEFTILSSYSKESKNFTFNIIQDGFIPEKVITKSFIEFKNIVASVVAGIQKPEPEPVESSIVDIDWELTEDELNSKEFIQSLALDEEYVFALPEIGETEDPVLLALNKSLEAGTEEDYLAFREALDASLNQTENV